MVGEKAEVMATACTLALRLAALRCAEPRDVRLGAVERLRLAHADDLLLHTRRSRRRPSRASARKARRARRAKEVVIASMTGMIVKLTSASGRLSSSMAMMMPIRLKSEPSKLRQPCESNWLMRVHIVDDAAHQVADGGRSK